MFDQLTKQLDEIFHSLKRRGKLSEKNIEDAMREIRLALLEADVQYDVVRSFVARVKERAVGTEVSKALNPGQQVVKIVNQELIQILGEPVPINTSSEKPLVIMLAGLQGSGKTTSVAKIGRLLKKKGEKVLLVAADPYRPAAANQLQVLGEQHDGGAEQAPGCHDVIAGPEQPHAGGQDRGHPRRGGHAGLPALERGQALLERGHRGVGEPGIDVAVGIAAKTRRRLRRAGEDETGGGEYGLGMLGFPRPFIDSSG